MVYKHSSGEFLVDAYIMRHHRSRWARAAVHMTVSPAATAASAERKSFFIIDLVFKVYYYYNKGKQIMRNLDE